MFVVRACIFDVVRVCIFHRDLPRVCVVRVCIFGGTDAFLICTKQANRGNSWQIVDDAEYIHTLIDGDEDHGAATEWQLELKRMKLGGQLFVTSEVPACHCLWI